MEPHTKGKRHRGRLLAKEIAAKELPEDKDINDSDVVDVRKSGNTSSEW